MLLGEAYDFTIQMFIQFYSLLNAHVSILDSMKINENIIKFEHTHLHVLEVETCGLRKITFNILTFT